MPVSSDILLALAREAQEVFHKDAFIPAGDPSMGGAPTGGAPPGGAPPGMPPGGAPMDPSMMGGAPPMDPAEAGGGGGAPEGAPGGAEVMMQQILQKLNTIGPAGAGGAGGAGGIKPKIDLNSVLLLILKLLARIADALGVNIPAHEMVATQADLTQFANQQQGGGPAAVPMQPGSVQPVGGVDPMQGAMPQPKAGSFHEDGFAFDPNGVVGTTYDSAGQTRLSDRAAAIQLLRRDRRS